MKVTFSTRETTGGLQALERRIRLLKLKKSFVKAGVLGKNKARSEGQISNPELAAVHEYGTSRVPARPFILPPFLQNREKYLEILKKGFAQAVTKDSPDAFLKILRLLGQKMAADIKFYVTGGGPIPPPNSPETIKRKGSSRTLVDTGQLVRGVDFEVVE